jgi:prepilin-type N-terminal cleavage/methylation domain-containing protein
MKPAGILNGKPGGFTLLEVIIALIVGSILGAILLEFLGQTVHKSFVPIKMAQESTDLTAIVEKMTADYKKQLAQSENPLIDFKSDIENNSGNYGDYTWSTSWITFDGSGNEAQDNDPLSPFYHRVLKVTVVRGQHEITTLYTR